MVCEIRGGAQSLARSASHAHYEVATEEQARLTRLDVLKSLVGHDCGVGRGSQAVRCELVCVGGGGILWIRRVCS